MEPSVCEELDRLARVVVSAVPSKILRATLSADPTDASAVWKLVRQFHPFSRGWFWMQGRHRSDMQIGAGSGARRQGSRLDHPDPCAEHKDVWGAEELAAHYTAKTGKRFDPYELLCEFDPTIRCGGGPGGFRQYHAQLRYLIWAFCGQPGRLESKGFLESLPPLSEPAREELCSFGALNPAHELNVILDSLQAKVVTRSEKVDSRWGGIPQMKLVVGPLPEPTIGAFWRRVFTAFRGTFVINPPTDLRKAGRALGKQVQERRRRLHLPSHPIPQPQGKRAERYLAALVRTAELSEKRWSPKRIALEMKVSLRTVHYRLKAARAQGLLRA